MKKYLRSLPVRVRLALSLPLLVLSFFLLWWATGWAWPTQTLALRALETEYGFGPGEIAAQGEITFDADYTARFGTLPSVWLVSRTEDAFAVALLEHRPGPLWRALTRPSPCLSWTGCFPRPMWWPWPSPTMGIPPDLWATASCC